MAVDLAEQAASGVARFDELFHRHYVAMVRLADLLTGSNVAADDIVQDAFVAVHRAWDRINDPLAYLRTCVVTGCRSWQRRRRREATRLSKGAESETMSMETHELLDAVSQLPWGQRSALVLRYYGDLSEAEIAAAMGCRAGTVKSHLHRGLAALREVIER
jgi:RNA polymerase sigma-70 factor (sigma-E family)